MFTRTVNSNVLEAEGLNAPTRLTPMRHLPWGSVSTTEDGGVMDDSNRSGDSSSSKYEYCGAAAVTSSSPYPTRPVEPPPHKMTLWQRFLDPSHAHKPRRVIDASTPNTNIDEAHNARWYTTTSMLLSMLSLAEYVGVREDVPYTNTHHSGEFVRMWVIAANVMQANYYLVCGDIAGLVVSRMRYKYAYYIAGAMGQLRATIASFIAAAGYYYTFEYLYTYGPPLLRIRDPSPTGYRLCWREGQSCYLSRALASLWVPLGFAFYLGTFKKFGMVTALTVFCNVYFEYARINVMPGTRLMISDIAYAHMRRDGAVGSLVPQSRRFVDPDTTRNESVAQNRYFRVLSTSMQNTIWENSIAYTDVQEHQSLKRIPNPYYNWSKAKQMYDDKPCAYKNDLWQLPHILGACARQFT